MTDDAAGRDGDAPSGDAPPGDAPDSLDDAESLLLDMMLGKLATYLRMCGYDTAYALDRDVEADDPLLELAAAEGRRLVTRDEQLAARAPAGVLVRSRDVTDQLRELADAEFELELADPLRRCSRCNGDLAAVPADADTPEYAPDADETRVWRCVDCGQHFWKGSHWDDVRERLAGV